MAKKSVKKTGAESVRWDLGIFYSGLDDPKIDRDTDQWVALAEKFHKTHKGNLGTTLGKALSDLCEIDMLGNALMPYFAVREELDVNDEANKAKKESVAQKLTKASGEYLTFFDNELCALDQSVIDQLTKSDPVVAKHRPLIDLKRVFKPHNLSDEVEAALAKRSQYDSGTWGGFHGEVSADMRFEHKGKKLRFEEAWNIMEMSKDAKERAAVLKAVNDGLKGYYIKYAAQALNMAIGAKKVEDEERSYKHPMEGRNKGSQIPDGVVEALHRAVKEVGGPLAQRYYRLKAKHLKQKKLRWSDRNAPLPFSDTALVKWDDAIQIVLTAYESFSPTLANLIRDSIAKKFIDAPSVAGKQPGAFNYSISLPGNVPVSLTYLNYLGSVGDVATLAHELGHGVHGILACEAQGPLMMHAPMAYAETASVFGEMTTFNYLKAELSKKGDTKQMLALTMDKLDSMINTVVRQIGFSNFERRIHGFDPKTMSRGATPRLSHEDFDRIWVETRNELYGKDGDVFTYENSEHLWAYVGHFFRPFYVYAYAFGELLTHSLYAKKESFGDRFEGLYLDLLRAGGTKDVVQLLKPFGLDPTDPQFWVNGLNVSIGKMLKEAEDLSATMSIKIK